MGQADAGLVSEFQMLKRTACGRLVKNFLWSRERWGASLLQIVNLFWQIIIPNPKNSWVVFFSVPLWCHKIHFTTGIAHGLEFGQLYMHRVINGEANRTTHLLLLLLLLLLLSFRVKSIRTTAFNWIPAHLVLLESRSTLVINWRCARRLEPVIVSALHTEFNRVLALFPPPRQTWLIGSVDWLWKRGHWWAFWGHLRYLIPVSV